MSNDLVPAEPQFLPPMDAELQTDLAEARKTQQNLINKAIDALDGITEVATVSQHPRAYEVASQLIKTLSEINKDFVDLAMRKQQVKDLPGTTHETSGGQVITNNNLFVGTTADLQAALKAMRKRDND
jgi:hypothetical protein